MRIGTLIGLCVFCWSGAFAAQLRSGPMLGHVDVVEATIWLQTDESADVQVRYWPQAHREAVHTTPPIRTTTTSHFIAKIIVSDLNENTSYGYEVLLDGAVVPRPYATTFQTQKHWWWRSDPPDIRIAVGSCFYVNDPPYDRPGTPYGGGFEILNAIASSEADLMIWSGDNTYFRESDFQSPTRLNYRWQHTRSLPELQPLLAAMAHYATWDDHDFGPNDANRSYGLKQHTLDLFKAYWTNPQFGTDTTPGVFGLVNWGDVDIFFLDDRYHRAPNEDPNPHKDYLGAPQLQWLKDALLTSQASFKLVVNGGQFNNPHGANDEGFHNYLGEYNDFFTWLAHAEVAGLLFLSGDIHRTELIKTPRAERYPLYEFTCSPLTSGPSSAKRFKPNPFVVEGTRVAGKRNFGLLTITGKRGEREMLIETFDQKGQPLWQYRIPQKELQLSQ